ncbi:uncharacterized protein LOC128547194 [Mercenaria mercenaria]|uniref:uncharacterized protein LOC128547194 n=1 Tax=Mercenaria mercenaria TaxID=6596 RepID=UPI00234ECCD8|nr:uncharacterized protein LOC128547194 [Mercenaria mercenaria]
MKYIFKILNLLIILFYINMTIADENGNFSSSESSIKVSVPMTLRSMSIAETEQKQNKSGYAVNEKLNKTEKPISALTENESLQDVLTSEFDNSTDESNDEVDDIHSSFNLAIIPAAAVFVFVVIICFKCCKWLRQYTRGGNKEENFYAVIVTDDYKEYGHIDITSESASTACYDTVSSYTSFLKRSGNESSLSSLRKWQKDSIKSKSGTSSPSKTAKKGAGDESAIKQFNSVSSTGTKIDKTNGDFDVRLPSTSSAETVSEQLTDSPIFRRNNRFRVSFVTDAKPSASENKTPNGNIRHEKLMRSNLKKSSSTATSPEHSSLNITSERPPEETKMVDVGTQTNKSFRYSLRKTKGHVSDSDLDERLFCRLDTSTCIALQSDKSKCENDGGNDLSENSDNSKADKCLKRSSVSLEEDRKNSLSTVIPKTSKYPFDTNVEVIHHCKQTKESNENLDLVDDVFIEELITDSTPHCYKNQLPDFSFSSEPCNSVEKRCDERLLEGLPQPEIHLCSHCKTSICSNSDEPVCNEAKLQVSDKNHVIQTICEKCRLVHKDKENVSCETEKDNTEEVDVQKQSNVKDSDRPSSTISQESSGYAELSSSSNSSCSK